MKLLPPPGPERSRAVGLLVILLAALGYLVWPSDTPSPAPVIPSPIRAAGPATSAPPVAAATSGSLPVEVRLAALDLSTESPDVGRNLFRYGMRPPPPPPPRPPTEGSTGPPAPPEATGPPPVPLRLAGLATLPGEQRVATLKDPASGTVFQAVEGQVVDGRYRVVRIGLQSAVVAYVDGSGQRTIALGGG